MAWSNQSMAVSRISWFVMNHRMSSSSNLNLRLNPKIASTSSGMILPGVKSWNAKFLGWMKKTLVIVSWVRLQLRSGEEAVSIDYVYFEVPFLGVLDSMINFGWAASSSIWRSTFGDNYKAIFLSVFGHCRVWWKSAWWWSQMIWLLMHHLDKQLSCRFEDLTLSWLFSGFCISFGWVGGCCQNSCNLVLFDHVF